MPTTRELDKPLAVSSDAQAPQIAPRTYAMATDSNPETGHARCLRLQRECNVAAVPAVLLAVACLALIVVWSLSGVTTDVTLARTTAAEPNTTQRGP